MSTLPDILARILAHKIEEVAACRAETDAFELRHRAEAAAPARGFTAALTARIARKLPGVIAELKHASPSAGVLRADFHPAALACDYADSGAACLSVLTDRAFFKGSLAHLIEARAACTLPVLRKDFIIDDYQIYEARAAGADCILLIVAALDDAALRDFSQLAAALGMDVLVEVHDAEELERALALNITLIGINNRNLRTFRTELATTLDLLPRIPAGCLVVTESGIHRREDVVQLAARGVHAFLVGEALMRAERPGARLAELFFARDDATGAHMQPQSAEGKAAL